MPELDELFSLIDEMANRQRQRTVVRGKLGDGNSGLLVYDNAGEIVAGKVWVTMQVADTYGLTVTQAINRRVANIYGLPVLVAKNIDGFMEVIEEDSTVAIPFAGARNLNVPSHAWMHTWMGADPIVLDGFQFRPGSVRPNSPPDLTVVIEPFTYTYHGIRKFWPGGTLDLTAAVPATSGHQALVGIYINPYTHASGYDVTASGAVGSSSSTANPFTGVDATVVADLDVIRLVSIRLYNGQTQILPRDFVVDLRDYMSGEIDFIPNTPNMIDRDTEIYSGRNAVLTGAVEVTAILTVSGYLTVV